ncbi:MAG TPA: 50S ribosomal protein L23 [Candidatus Paceibacterota bacterium]
MANKFLIKHPLITEKAVALGQFGKYMFLVRPEATVSEIKKVVEQKYNVKVTKTNVINVKPKQKRLGRSVGTKSGYKKVIVTLKAGQKLDILPQ